MTKQRPKPSERMGVYKRLDEIPDRYRLANYSSQFRGKNTWGGFVESRVEEAGGKLSDSQAWIYDRCGRVWKEFMGERGRHHALAEPEHIESFVTDLDTDLTVSTTYETYFGPVMLFYNWLWHHVEYPHVYSPALIAADTGDIARKYWDYRMSIK